jgi:hypothetical protein
MQATIFMEPIFARRSRAMAAVRVARRRGESRRGRITAPRLEIVKHTVTPAVPTFLIIAARVRAEKRHERKWPPRPESGAGEALPICFRRDTCPNDYDVEFIVGQLQNLGARLGLTIAFLRSIWQLGGSLQTRSAS